MGLYVFPSLFRAKKFQFFPLCFCGHFDVNLICSSKNRPYSVDLTKNCRQNARPCAAAPDGINPQKSVEHSAQKNLLPAAGQFLIFS